MNHHSTNQLSGKILKQSAKLPLLAAFTLPLLPSCIHQQKTFDPSNYDGFTIVTPKWQPVETFLDKSKEKKVPTPSKAP